MNAADASGPVKQRAGPEVPTLCVRARVRVRVCACFLGLGPAELNALSPYDACDEPWTSFPLIASPQATSRRRPSDGARQKSREVATRLKGGPPSLLAFPQRYLAATAPHLSPFWKMFTCPARFTSPGWTLKSRLCSACRRVGAEVDTGNIMSAQGFSNMQTTRSALTVRAAVENASGKAALASARAPSTGNGSAGFRLRPISVKRRRGPPTGA